MRESQTHNHIQEILKRRTDAAQGVIPCDGVVKDVRYLDVFTCEWRRGDIAWIDGVIVGVEPGLKAKRTWDGSENGGGHWIVPGWIDAHVHVESSMMHPRYFEQVALKHGTTSAVCDPHELANVLGVDGIRYFLSASDQMQMDLWVMLSSCVPATNMETNGGGSISAEALLGLASHRRALGLAEVMNVPGVLHADPGILDKLAGFIDRPMDGHCPLLRGQGLSAYASTGISSCHESSELEEAREKISKGISIWIREGSVAKDLDTLVPLLSMATSTSMGFCTDDRNPLDILEEGHIDHLVRRAIQKGVSPEVAYRSASWSVARHYGLNQGLSRVGAIAPGYAADLVVLEDAQSCRIQSVMKHGVPISEIPLGNEFNDVALPGNTVCASTPEERDLEGPAGRVHVIGILPGKIITEHRILDSHAEGVARISVLERYGKGTAPANGYVQGFGKNFRGAIASSVGHDSHNLVVVGNLTRDMRVALQRLIQMGGGFCVVEGGQVTAELALPIGGLMSRKDPQAMCASLQKLKSASQSVGCELAEPFLQLAFLSLPVIPALKLTDQGLVDVEKFQIIPVAAVP